MEKNDCPYIREIDFPSIFDGASYTMKYCSRNLKMNQCHYDKKEMCFKWQKRQTVFCPACMYETLTGDVVEGQDYIDGLCSHCCRKYKFKFVDNVVWYTMEDI